MIYYFNLDLTGTVKLFDKYHGYNDFIASLYRYLQSLEACYYRVWNCIIIIYIKEIHDRQI